jgi:hypothetical protein
MLDNAEELLDDVRTLVGRLRVERGKVVIGPLGGGGPVKPDRGGLTMPVCLAAPKRDDIEKFFNQVLDAIFPR